MENLVFLGGEYGIYTTKCSPGWPFVLVESAFSGQRKSAILSRECGLTLSHVEFKDVPAADIVMDGYWEKLFWKDCVMENIAGPAIRISRENNSCTQINLRNIWCRNVPQLLLGKDSGKVTGGEQSEYMLHTLFHGDDLTLGQSEPERKTLVDWEPASQEPEFFREICDLPPAGDLEKCPRLRSLWQWHFR